MRVWLAAVIVVFAPLACTELSSGPASSSVEASSLWHSLDRPGCVDCSGKGPAARAWAEAYTGPSSAAAQANVDAAPEARQPSRDAQAQANFDAALAGKPLPFPLFAETFKAEIAAEKEAAPPSSPPVAPRPRALTAQAFASRLTWNDMESIGIFAGRMPAGVSGGPVGRTGGTRRFQYDFPGGGAIIVLVRPCERGRGLCIWSVDVE